MSWLRCLQEAAQKLETARKEGTGWVKVDKDLVARIQSARQKVDAALQKAVRALACSAASRSTHNRTPIYVQSGFMCFCFMPQPVVQQLKNMKI